MKKLKLEKEQLSHLPVDPGGSAAGKAFVPISFAGTCSIHSGGDYCPLGPGKQVD